MKLRWWNLDRDDDDDPTNGTAVGIASALYFPGHSAEVVLVPCSATNPPTEFLGKRERAYVKGGWTR